MSEAYDLATQFDPPADYIAAGQTLAFSSRLSNPPSGVQEAVLSFTLNSSENM